MITLRFHFTTGTGVEAGTKEVTVQAPAAEAEVAWSTQFSSSESVIGFWSEVVRP